MHHKAVLTVGKFPKKPYHIECACHSAGDFPKEELAVQWFKVHTSRIGKSETSELFVPGAVQAQPKTAPKPPAPPKAPEGVAKGGAK